MKVRHHVYFINVERIQTHQTDLIDSAGQKVKMTIALGGHDDSAVSIAQRLKITNEVLGTGANAEPYYSLPRSAFGYFCHDFASP